MKEKHPVLFWTWNAFALLMAGALLGVVSLWFAKGSFGMPMFLSYLQNPWLLFLNLAPVVLLALLLWAVTKRTWLAFFLTSVIVAVPTMASFYKLTFRNDPMLFEDVLLIKEAGNMAGKYQLFLNRSMIFAIAAIVLGTVFLAFLCRGKLRGWSRLTVVAIVLLCALPVQQLILDQDVYQTKTANEDLISHWSATDVYLSKGFVYPFLYSATQVGDPAPQGYSAAQAEAQLAAYTDADIPEDKKINVVCIMLEAFQDFSRFGTPELAYDLYAPYHALEAESYTGDLVTNIFAGGTVNTERCFLTGYSQLGSFRTPTNAYPWYFRTQGYQVTGMHPCYQWFYNRANINENLGFEHYDYVENYFGELTGGGVGYDNIFFPALIRDLEERQRSDQPIFSFSVSYQGHGPYSATQADWGNVYDIVSPTAGYSEPSAYIMANYFGQVSNTIGHLLELRDFLAAQDEPYVLVVFGDHNPWMGDGNSVYQEMGLNLDLGTLDGVLNYYSTRYLIWANDAAKDVAGNDFVGEGPRMGPYFLMNQLFDLCGWEGPAYMQATRQVGRQVSVQFTSGVCMEGDFIGWPDELSPEGGVLSRDYAQLQYYARRHFLYGGVN